MEKERKRGRDKFKKYKYISKKPYQTNRIMLSRRYILRRVMTYQERLYIIGIITYHILSL